MLERQVRLARGIAELIMGSDIFELLPTPTNGDILQDARLRNIYIIVLFCAKDAALNRELVQRINATRRLYVSGTQWDGKPAARFAVANWQVDVDRDLKIRGLDIGLLLDGLVKGGPELKTQLRPNQF